jgi:hypothetical protein
VQTTVPDVFTKRFEQRRQIALLSRVWGRLMREAGALRGLRLNAGRAIVSEDVQQEQTRQGQGQGTGAGKV